MKNKSFWRAMLSLMATVIVLFALGGITVLADNPDRSQTEIFDSGYCGAEGNKENVSWTLDNAGVLTISGTGEMADYDYYGYCPWKDYKELWVNAWIKPPVIKMVIIKGVTNIGSYAFKDCTSLASIIIPNSVTSIGDYSFWGCTSLTSINMPNSITSIGKGAFDNCTSLKILQIPESVTSIGEYAFSSCKSLESITIPEGVTSISEATFFFCTSLKSINIPNSVTSIEYNAFNSCTSLTSITIPKGVTSIGDGAFYSCTSLTSVAIPGSVTNIGVKAFSGCKSLGSISIPESITKINAQTFYGCTWLMHVTIPDSVTCIGEQAFSGCKSLGSISIPESVINIDNQAFFDCESLTSITISDNITSISEATFAHCKSLKSITIPNSVTSIGGQAFHNCTSLASVIIPDSVTCIGEQAFYGCTLLTSVIIPDSVTSIGEQAFYGCTLLTSVIIPDSVTSIGDASFYYCESLTSITISDNVTSISDATFAYCKSLKSITIPNSVTSIGYQAFYSCTSLRSITIPNRVTSIGGQAFYNCTSLASVNIPDSVTSIGDVAFYNCSSLTSIIIPDNITSIGYNTFAECQILNNVVLNKNVYYSGAFPNYSETVFHYYYDVNYLNSENGNISGKFRSFGGDEFYFTVSPNSNYGINKVTLSYAGKTVEITPDANGKYKYTMPDSDAAVTVSATFKYLGELNISSQPENFEGLIGETAAFKVVAQGNDMTYQWQVYKNDAWKNTSLTGNKSATLYVDITESRDGMKFRCVITDSEGNTVLSDDVTLKVYPLKIKQQPLNFDGLVGETATFNVEAEGDNLTYQWQVYKSGAWKNTSMPGNNTETLDVGIVASRNGMQFRCVVTDNNGFMIVSKTVKLTIPIVITEQPKDFIGSIGEKATFNISAEGKNIEYQWQVYNSGAWVNISIQGCKTKCLEIEIDPSLKNMQFRCLVTTNNEFVAVSKPAILKIPVIISEQPQDYCGTANETAIYSISAEGDDLKYQWQVFKSGAWKNTSLPGNKTDTLEVVIDSSRDGMQFRCVVTGINGYRVISDIATLTVNPICIISQPEDYIGYINGRAYFYVYATGNGIKYQWQVFKSGEWIDSDLPDSKTSMIQINSLTADDGIRLRCLVTDKDGFVLASREVSLTVYPITIIEEPHDVNCPPGSIAVFNVKAEGEGLSYQWQIFKNNAWKNTSLAGNKTDTLEFEALPSRFGLPFRCAITDINGYTAYSEVVWLSLPEAYATGNLGTDIIWYIDMNGTFNMYGKGEMTCYDNIGWRWLSDSDRINSVVVSDNITTIGEYAFAGSYNLTDVFLPYSVNYIGEGAFYLCDSLNSVVLNKEAYNADAFLDVSPDIFHFYYDVSYISNGNGTVTGKQRSFGTDTNELSIVPNDGFKVGKVTAIDENGNEIELYPDVDGVVTMPDSDTDILINVTFVPTLSISNQPDDYSGTVGDIATFEIEAEGENLSYQWQVYKNGAWKNTSLTGNATDRLEVEILESRIGMQFRCIVKDANGNSATSDTATIEISPITINEQPEDYEGTIGEVATFIVDADGEDLSYQWQVYKSGAWKNTSLSGNTTSSLDVEITEARDGMTFRCVVKDGNGNKAISEEATITVKPFTIVITKQPKDFEGVIGQAAIFEIEAEGEGLTYQWQVYKNGVWKNTSLYGNDSSSLLVDVIESRNGMTFRCVISDADGNEIISDEVMITII